MNNRLIILICFVFLNRSIVEAQTQNQALVIKEAMNSFAQFTSTKDLKNLENARKIIDNAYKTKVDSVAFRNNLVRSLVYSTFARLDSGLKFNYKKDPLDETLFSMNKVYGSKFQDEVQEQILYIENQLKLTYLYRANTTFKNRKYTEALKYFTILDSIDRDNLSILHNLAILCQETGNYIRSVGYYEKLISKNPKAEYYMVLANLYESLNDEKNMIRVLTKGSQAYTTNRDLVFKLLNILFNKNDYSEIIKFTDQALKLDENNINLNYLAGFSYEMTGNISKAEEYYKVILTINPNNYEANFALGLLYLNLYLKDKEQSGMMYVSKYYLNKANEIDPNELKTLTSLSILYNNTGEVSELQKIKNKINQLKLN
ncbi:MAG: tetratricopeptide repeat protein [Bacteroidetes bacterium]|nr:tetratricopeptide repeat protein [Bacteroidota bacterium]